MKTALILALCAGALLQAAPSLADARSKKTPTGPGFALGSVEYKKLPKDVRHAFEDYRRAERRGPFRCYGLSEKNFEKRMGLLAPMDYNGDGVVDYLFNSPCRPHLLPEAADILMSNPLGYAVSRKFEAFVDVVNGQPALLVEAPCEAGGPEEQDGRSCYLARIWNRDNGRWLGAKRVSLAPDGDGFLIAPFDRPTPPPPPQTVAVAPLRVPPPAPPRDLAPLPAVQTAPSRTTPVAATPRAAAKPAAAPKAAAAAHTTTDHAVH